MAHKLMVVALMFLAVAAAFAADAPSSSPSGSPQFGTPTQAPKPSTTPASVSPAKAPASTTPVSVSPAKAPASRTPPAPVSPPFTRTPAVPRGPDAESPFSFDDDYTGEGPASDVFAPAGSQSSDSGSAYDTPVEETESTSSGSSLRFTAGSAVLAAATVFLF